MKKTYYVRVDWKVKTMSNFYDKILSFLDFIFKMKPSFTQNKSRKYIIRKHFFNFYFLLWFHRNGDV